MLVILIILCVIVAGRFGRAGAKEAARHILFAVLYLYGTIIGIAAICGLMGYDWDKGWIETLTPFVGYFIAFWRLRLAMEEGKQYRETHAALRKIDERTARENRRRQRETCDGRR